MQIGAASKSFVSGYTLVELLIVLAIISIVATGSAPSLKLLAEKNTVDSASNTLRKGIAMARNLAVNTSQIITICPQNDGQCSNEWRHAYMIFIDRNNNALLDDSDELFEKTRLQKGVEIHWKASGGASYLKFSPTGIARQFGRFHICKNNADNRSARAMVINRQGRLRMYKDRNGDGIVEDLDGREPDCSS